MTNPRLSPADWGLLFLLAGIWSVSYLLNRINLTELPVMTAVLGRVGFAAVALWLAVRLLGVAMPREPSIWRGYVVIGLLNNILPFALILSGQDAGVDSGLTAILIGTTPLFGALMASLLVKDETLSAGRIGGILLGILGLVVLIGPDALTGAGATLAGQFLIVGGALSYAVSAVYSRRFRGQSPVATATGQMTCSTLILLPVVAVVDQPWRLDPSAGIWASVLTIAVACTAGAYILYFRILASAGATNLLLVTLLVPVGAVAWGAAIFAEPVTWPMIAGAGLIFLGLTIIDGRLPALIARRLGVRRTG